MLAVLSFIGFMLALMLVLALRVPVAAALGLVGTVGTALFVSPAAVAQIGNIAFSQSSSFVLVVVPLFILMGEVLASTSIGRDLFHTAQMWLRRLPASLGVATILACAGFAAVCGSSPVTAATIGSISVKEMVQRGYDRSLALGTTAAGGTLGILIPPSIPLIIYGVITETSIGDLFLAGIVPGLLIAALLSVTLIGRVVARPHLAPRQPERASWPVKWRALGSVAPVLILAVLVLGSIYSGAATPTEAGAVGALAAVIVAAVLGQLGLPALCAALDRTARTTAMFLFMLIGGLFASFMLTRLGIPQGMSEFLTALPVPGWAIIVLINVMLLVLGMVLDPTSVLVIVVPIFFSSVVQLGYDPVWFGIVVAIQIEVAAITPPVGFNLFVLKSVVPGATLGEVVRGAATYVVPMLTAVLLLIAFPGIATFLPETFGP